MKPLSRILGWVATLLALSTGVWHAAQATPGPGKDRHIQVLLTRNYGNRTVCRVFVSAVGVGTNGLDRWDSGYVSYGCNPPERLPSERAHRPLTQDELRTFVASFLRADLATAPDGGFDGTPMDGLFETLTVTDGRTFIVVTSGNPAFTDGPRRSFLRWLIEREEELRRDLTGR